MQMYAVSMKHFYQKKKLNIIRIAATVIVFFGLFVLRIKLESFIK